MRKIIFIIFCICSTQIAFSQENTDSLKTNTTAVIQDNRIDKLGKTYQKTFALKGYRVQIHQGNKRQPANQARASFSRVHPKTKAHLEYEQPYYKVRVGDFKTKLEALKYKNFIIKQFPNSFIVSDEIDIEELIK